MPENNADQAERFFGLLSRVLVAFTIELDNEFEHRTPHSTTIGGWAGGPWLTSLVMYENLMQFVPEEGASIAELQRMARTERLSLTGMQRWGYIIIEGKLVRPTRKGLRAKRVWAGLFEVIEERWRTRFGAEAMARVRESLTAVVNRIEMELPDYLPVLGYGLSMEVPPQGGSRCVEPAPRLTALLSKVLQAFALDFEREAVVSLAICANVLRLLGDEGVRVRDLPRLSGVSKEAIQMALSFLTKRGFTVVEQDPTAGRTKLVRLTLQGRLAQANYRETLGAVEKRWRERFGEETIRNLRESLLPLALEPLAEPYPDGWRASVRRPETLPHFPTVLHRGGYPDGS